MTLEDRIPNMTLIEIQDEFQCNLFQASQIQEIYLKNPNPIEYKSEHKEDVYDNCKPVHLIEEITPAPEFDFLENLIAQSNEDGQNKDSQ